MEDYSTMTTLADVFEHTLKDMFYAETAITMALPKVIEDVNQPNLKLALTEHLAETQEQIRMLEDVFETISQKPSAHKCDAIEGLIKETNGIMSELQGPGAKDAALAAACQAIEHYEIARYGTLREWAKSLNNDEAHMILSDILDQEKAANSKLNAIAIEFLNRG
jgi:ferritin-like metal-binding protein YciE